MISFDPFWIEIFIFRLWTCFSCITVRDATAKSVTGILTGSISQFGQFQECLEAQAPFPTQYCLTSITASNIPEPSPTRNPKSLEYDPNESVLSKIYVSITKLFLELLWRREVNSQSVIKDCNNENDRLV